MAFSICPWAASSWHFITCGREFLSVLTLIGWGLLIKGLLRFCVPTHGLRMMARVSVARSWEFQVAGVALVVLAGVLSYDVFAR